MTMDTPMLPTSTEDVLKLPKTVIPNVIRSLRHSGGLSALVRIIHDDEWSGDHERKERARAALRHLGFPD